MAGEKRRCGQMAKNNISQLNNAYTREHEQKHKRTPNPRAHAVHMKRIRNLLILIVAILGFGGLSLVRTQMALGETNHAVQKAKGSLTKLKANKSALKVQVDQLHNDDYTAKLIGEKYLYSKQGEIIFNLPDKVNKVPDLNVNQ